MRANRLNLGRGRQPRRRHPVEDWRGGRALHTQRLEFRDMFFHRRCIASRPAGYDRIVDANLAPYRGATETPIGMSSTAPVGAIANSIWAEARHKTALSQVWAPLRHGHRTIQGC